MCSEPPGSQPPGSEPPGSVPRRQFPSRHRRRLSRSALMAPPIRTEWLCKRYGEAVALEDLQLTAQPGEVYGQLGTSGAGETLLHHYDGSDGVGGR